MGRLCSWLWLFLAVARALRPVTRRDCLFRASLPWWSLPVPAFAEDTAAESVRKAAANVPGLGPPDVLYPPAFRGRWLLRRETTNVTFLGRDEVAPPPLMIADERVEAFFRFVPYDDAPPTSGRVVADRGFNAEQFAKARGDGDVKASWEPSNPNVLVQEGTGLVEERKVTKRSYEEPSPTTFGSSEYARIAVARQDLANGVPQILAQRTLTRWRWDEAAPRVIDGIELVSTYDPRATGFADLNGATPIAVVKSNLRLSRE